MANNYSRKKGRPKNKRDLIRISSHIPKHHYDLMKMIVDEDDLSMAQVLRRAIELYLCTQKDVLGIEDSEIAMANHISEDRTNKALILHYKDNLPKSPFDKSNSADELFEELNPDAF